MLIVPTIVLLLNIRVGKDISSALVRGHYISSRRDGHWQYLVTIQLST